MVKRLFLIVQTFSLIALASAIAIAQNRQPSPSNAQSEQVTPAADHHQHVFSPAYTEKFLPAGSKTITAADLVIWNDALTSGRLGKFVTEKLQEQARLNNGRKLKYARGLMVDTPGGSRLVSHSGGAAGYSAWLGRLPEHGLSVAVLCNSDVASASALAGRVADQFLPTPTAETAKAAAVSLPS